MANKVIVFGPTGYVGSVASLTAHEHGAQVTLAMRDPSKTIPGLSQSLESSGKFTRIQADLTKPETVSSAVSQSGAKRAFIYCAHGTTDHMLSTAQALKSSGIEFVVLLSSSTINDMPLESVSKEEAIPYAHAQVEMSLDRVYGKGEYVAIRPGGFATNLLRFSRGISSGEVKLWGPDAAFDCITPGDMGRVSGTILAQGQAKDGQDKVYLYGPNVLPQREAIGIVGKVLGREIQVKGLSPDEARQQYLASGVPAPMTEYMIRLLSGDDDGHTVRRVRYDEGVENVKRYTGRPSMGFQEWVEGNKQLFGA